MFITDDPLLKCVKKNTQFIYYQIVVLYVV